MVPANPWGSSVDPGFPSCTAVLVTRNHLSFGPLKKNGTFGEDLEGLLDLYSGCGGTTMSREPLSLFGAKDPVAPILIIHSPLATCGLRPSTREEMRDAVLHHVLWQCLTMSDSFYVCLPLSFYHLLSHMLRSWLNHENLPVSSVQNPSCLISSTLSSSIKQLGYLGEIRPLNH